MATFDELEEAVANLQTEVAAMRHLMKFLFVQRNIENPGALNALSQLLGTTLGGMAEDGYSEYVNDEIQKLLGESQHLYDAFSGKKDQT